MKLPIYQIDAFAEKAFQGNPAAVCPLEKWLPDELLQSIAEENNLAETAFYVKKGEAYDLRWFTPTKEVDLCGHATIAAAYVLFEKGNLKKDQVTFHSRSGDLRVKKTNDLLTLDFPAQTGIPCDIPEVLIKALGVRPKEFYRAMDYMAVFDNEETIVAIEPDFQLLKELDLRGVIITAPGKKVDFVSRFFAPNYGINEDPVTGSAHCVLAPYWASKLGRKSLSALQLSKRTGALQCEVMGDRVFISGRAVPYLEGSIQVDC
jgi:PhzF family phenazine biosynthesis protein